MTLFLRGLRLVLRIFFLTLSFGLIAVAIFYPSLLKHFIEWLQGVVNILWWLNRPLAFGLGFIESIPLLGMSIPGQNALFIIGWFVAQTYWWTLTAVVAVAIILGDIVGYLIGKHMGDKFIDQFGKYFWVGKTEVQYMWRGLDKYGAWAIVLSKRNGYMRGIIPFIAWTSKMKRWTFMLFNILWSVIYAVVLITLARIFVGYYEQVIPYIRWIMLGFLVVVWSYFRFFKRDSLKRYIKDKEKELEEAESVLKEVEKKI